MLLSNIDKNEFMSKGNDNVFQNLLMGIRRGCSLVFLSDKEMVG
jgi:hypothetical protein